MKASRAYRLAPHLTLTLLLLGLLHAPAQAAEKVTIKVTVAQASGPNAENPKVDPQLAPYKKVLSALGGFGQFSFVGRDSKQVGEGEQATLNAGAYQCEVTVAKIEDGAASVNWVLKKGGEEVGKGGFKLKAGSVVPQQLGDPKAPLIPLFERGN
ncbi:MAG: hypothetical protein AMXMBFR7_16820 [Planctomycetota bacterium]